MGGKGAIRQLPIARGMGKHFALPQSSTSIHLLISYMYTCVLRTRHTPAVLNFSGVVTLSHAWLTFLPLHFVPASVELFPELENQPG